MEKAVKILVLNNEIEAKLLSEILKDNNIPHLIRSYYDLAYDGLFQKQAGWGHVEAPEAYREEITRIYSEMSENIQPE
ncbi:MAG: hypothetical protein HPY62_03310 [Bacteroidales bacterium]|nr:hypothetical protein [Bacteroidales bacterium]